jgi:trk system potassium uptake protein TrkH
MVLMLLGATNFMVHLYLFRRHFKKAYKHLELKFLLIYGTFMIVFLMISSKMFNMNESIRFNLFHFISSMSSTGLLISTKTFISYTPVFLMLTTIIMAIGGGGGSTAGGIKLYRMAIFFKSNRWHLKEKIENPRQIEVKHFYYLGDKRKITDKVIISNYAFISLYILVLLVGSMFVSSYGYPFINSVFEVSSLIGNSGLSIGIMTNPNRSETLLWLGTITMLIGRLEIYPVFFGIVKVFLDFKEIVKK